MTVYNPLSPGFPGQGIEATLRSEAFYGRSPSVVIMKQPEEEFEAEVSLS